MALTSTTKHLPRRLPSMKLLLILLSLDGLKKMLRMSRRKPPMLWGSEVGTGLNNAYYSMTRCFSYKCHKRRISCVVGVFECSLSRVLYGITKPSARDVSAVCSPKSCSSMNTLLRAPSSEIITPESTTSAIFTSP